MVSGIASAASRWTVYIVPKSRQSHSEQGSVAPHSEQGRVDPHSEQGATAPHSEQGSTPPPLPHSEQGNGALFA